MSKKQPGHLDKISHNDKKRHFSGFLWGGKGDKPRKFTKAGNEAYRNNKFWDNCKAQ